MAQLLVNAFELIVGVALPPGPDAFRDDDPAVTDNTSAIDALAAANVVEGVGGELYDPDGTVTRGQMGSYLARFLELLTDRGIRVGHLEGRAR
jgi:hypothetical protein